MAAVIIVKLNIHYNLLYQFKTVSIRFSGNPSFILEKTILLQYCFTSFIFYNLNKSLYHQFQINIISQHNNLFLLFNIFLEPPRDALDSLILSQVDLESLENVEQTEFIPFDPIAKRTEGSITDTLTGEKFKTTKGAPHVIIQLSNNEGMKKKCADDVISFGMRGIRSLAVAKTDQNGK